jgi:hypothetical protein
VLVRILEWEAWTRMDIANAFGVLSRTAASPALPQQCRKQSLGYRHYRIEVRVEAGPSLHAGRAARAQTGFIAIVRVRRAGSRMAVFSPLRFGAQGGRPFLTEDEAVLGGFDAGQRMVDDLILSDAG